MVIVVAIIMLVFSAAIFHQSDRESLDQEKWFPTPSAQEPPIIKKSPPVKSSTPAPAKNSPEISGWKYPNSTALQSIATSLILESGDDPDIITSWYRQEFKNLRMTAKSFVLTKTNDKVLNKLVGADGQREIRVEISRNPNQTVSKITVSITST